MEVEATAPCRADIAGGTLDIWPLGPLHPGAMTVNAAIPMPVRLRVDDEAPGGEVWHAIGAAPWRVLAAARAVSDLTAEVCAWLRPQGGLRVRVESQAPMGSGLGGSSAYAVALAGAVLALDGARLEDADLVAVLRDLEARVLCAPTGTQDHWAALRGGAMALHLEPGRERVEELAIDRVWLAGRMTVFFTGITHHSGMVNWQVIRRRLEGSSQTAGALDEIAAAAGRCREALLAGDAAEVASAIRAEWEARKRLAPEVCPPDLHRLEAVALGNGAEAVKACGAGGGGSLLVWHAPERREDLIRALAAAAPSGFALPRGAAVAGCAVRRLA